MDATIRPRDPQWDCVKFGLWKGACVRACVWECALDLAYSVDRDRGKLLGGVQDVTYVFRVHRKPPVRELSRFRHLHAL